ncbi:CDP-diacylglycerol diphosphatase [Nostoc sp. MG11]|uniref:CDP-diacylglycerol diphosphatase n=1 Tax=Nostoc sp. MG11 TaxID=2721166 RepID=UPI001865B532|nr:CDP-diacylglycerol diphosphatase [Nostoc sp. MG11]
MNIFLISKSTFINLFNNSFLQNQDKCKSIKYKNKYLLNILLTTLTGLSLDTIFNSQVLGSNGRDFLWEKVQKCVANQQGNPPKPDPCLYVDLNNRYVVANGSHSVEYLLLPTDKITGIENLSISTLNKPYYWQYAWEAAKTYIPQVKPKIKNPDQYGLAINSKQARGQDQLHIHISCINKKVSKKLEQNDNNIPSGSFKNFILTLDNNKYNIMKLTNNSLEASNNPFYLVKKSLHSSQNMADQSIAVAKRSKGGFYIMNTESSGGYQAAAEKLLDEDCK